MSKKDNKSQQRPVSLIHGKFQEIVIHMKRMSDEGTAALRIFADVVNDPKFKESRASVDTTKLVEEMHEVVASFLGESQSDITTLRDIVERSESSMKELRELQEDATANDNPLQQAILTKAIALNRREVELGEPAYDAMTAIEKVMQEVRFDMETRITEAFECLKDDIADMTKETKQ